MRVGLVGLGRWGRKCAAEWAELRREGRIDQLHVYDMKKAELDTRWDVVHGGLGTLLRDVDAVHIAVPNADHHQVALVALNAGRHALVEKPLTLGHKGALGLEQAAKANNCLLMPGHVYRHDAAVLAAKELLDGDAVGEPRYARMRWTAHHPSPPSPDGVIWDLLPHPVDILNHLWDSWPSAWRGMRAREAHDTVTQATLLLARYPKGRAAWFDLSWRDHHRQRIAELVCKDATVRIDLMAQTVQVFRDGKTETTHHPSNTIRNELLYFLSACEDPNSVARLTAAGVACVRAVEEAQPSWGKTTA